MNHNIISHLATYSLFSSIIALVLTFLLSILLVIVQKKYNVFFIIKNLYLSHTLFITITSICFFYLILSRDYNYYYIFQHIDNDTPLLYLISAFWGGQEGSMLFWITLNAIITSIFFLRRENSEVIYFTVSSLFQLLFILTISNIKIFNINIGNYIFSSTADFFQIDLSNKLMQLNYNDIISNGRGINPLLQNVWMAIHPPLIFIGYTFTMIPFLMSLNKSKYYYNTNEVLKFNIISLIFLSLGLITGGIWAYQALSFGGFWAWDPVENLSLIVFLLSLLNMHVLIIEKNNNTFFYSRIISSLPFISVIYASYLTRSGLLAETSVHSFISNNSNYLMLISLFIAFILLFYNIYLDINYANKTQNKINIEKYSSREALITLGNIIILIIILQILFTTSYPIVNKLFNINLSIPPNRIQFYNNILVILFIPLLITTVLSSLSSYKMEINISSYNSKFLLNLLLAIVIISLLYYYCPIKKLSYNITLYLLILLILVSISSKKLSTQSKLSHIGFATMFIGITIAFSDLKNYNKETSLYLHYNKIICNSNYKVIYNEISSYNRNTFFNISVIQKKDTINLKPFVTSNINYGRLFQPYIKNTFFNDWFAYITYIDSSNHLSIDTSITLKDSLLIFGYKFKFNNIKVIPMGGNNNIIISAYITVSDSSGKYWNIRPDYLVKNDYALSIPSTIRERSIEIYFSNVLPKENTIQIKVNKLTTPSINIKLIKYPLVWIIYSGFFIMFVGFILSLYKKFKTVKYGSSLSD